MILRLSAFILLTTSAFATGLCATSASACSAGRIEAQAEVRGATRPRFVWPVKGLLVVGCRSAIHGIDIALPCSTLVRAAADGVVIYAGDELKGYGVIVFIRHDHGWVTTYAQNSKASVHRGEQVRSGQSIAWAGAIAHPFRFEMSKDGKPVDPRGYLPPAAFRKWRL